jgi:nucleotide-binding universal stress UspA family protein
MNPGLVLGVIVLVAAALALLMAAVTFFAVRRPWRLRCPRDGREAQIQVDAAAAVRTELFGGSAGVARCSLWPVRGCGEACLELPADAHRPAARGAPLPHRPARPMILVPLDGTPAGEAVLPTARALAQEHGAGLRLLRVARARESVRDEDGRPISYADQETSSVEAAEQDYLRRVQATLAGVRVETEVRFGEPLAQILSAAEAPDVMLIAMAPGRQGRLGRRLAPRVARAAWVPVVQAASAAATPPAGRHP